jgi:hypothetical protein
LAPLALCGRDGPLAVRGGGEGCLMGVLPRVAGVGLGTLSVGDSVDDGTGLSSSECGAGGSRWGCCCLWSGWARWHCGAAGEPRVRAVTSCARERVTHIHRTWLVLFARGVRAGTAATASPHGTCIPRGGASGTWRCSCQHIGLQPLAHRVAAASTSARGEALSATRPLGCLGDGGASCR